MSDEKISTRFKLLAESTDKLLLSGRIEIDHDVPTQDQRKHANVGEGFHQVRALELDEAANLGLDATEALGFTAASEQIFFNHGAIHALNPLYRINSELACGDCPG